MHRIFIIVFVGLLASSADAYDIQNQIVKAEKDLAKAARRKMLAVQGVSSNGVELLKLEKGYTERRPSSKETAALVKAIVDYLYGEATSNSVAGATATLEKKKRTKRTKRKKEKPQRP